MGKIICLMGKSSSGKDTIYKNLMGRQVTGTSEADPLHDPPHAGRGAGRCGIPFYR